MVMSLLENESPNFMAVPINQHLLQTSAHMDEILAPNPVEDEEAHEQDDPRDGAVLEVEAPRFMEAMTPMMKVHNPPLQPSSALNRDDSISSAEFLRQAPNTSSTTDWKDEFQSKLFDRSKEQQALLQAYHSIVGVRRSASFGSSLRSLSGLSVGIGSDNSKEVSPLFVLISGPRGSGKTHLGHTLRPQVTRDGGYFIMGKFEQLERPEPFTALVCAFKQYVDLVLSQGEEVVARIRDRILTTMGREIGCLLGLFPAFAKIVGFATEESGHGGMCNGGRGFLTTMKTFLRAICSANHPIVLLFDDLHYADKCSLKMMRLFASHANSLRPGSLVVLGTCLNTISPNSLLATSLREMEDEDGTQIFNISCGGLVPSELKPLIRESLDLCDEHCEKLSNIVAHQTNGNMVYVMEFMRWAEDEGLLSYEKGAWKWHQEDFSLTIECHRKGDFLTDMLERLPHDVKEVLKVAACLGSTVDQVLVSLLLEVPVGDLLQLAADKGALVTIHTTERGNEFQFQSDTIQKAAYNLIAEEERMQFHLDMGRGLLKKLNTDEKLEKHLFSVLSQFKIGAPLLTNQTEKHAIAIVCLHAGKSAARSSGFRAASEYLLFGISLLTDRKWMGKESELCLALHNAAAEVFLCLADFERVDTLLHDTLSNTRHCCDKLQARCTQIYSLGLRDRQQEAIDLGFEVLATMDFTFPKKLCTAHLNSDMKRVERSLRGKRDEQLLGLPRMTEFKPLMAMRIMSLVSLDCMVTRPKLWPFLTLKMMSLTMKYGLCEHASAAFGSYGMLCLSVRQNMDEGYRFGQVALKLLNMYKMDEYLPRVHAAVHGVLAAWKKPVKESLEPLMRGHKVGLLTGDTEYAALNANLYCWLKIWAGPSLVEVEKDQAKIRSWMIEQKVETGLRFMEPDAHLVHVLMGKIEDPANTTFLDSQLEHAAKTRNSMLEAGVNDQKLIVGYLFNNCILRDEVFEDSQVPNGVDFTMAISKLFKGLYCLRLARAGYKKRKSLRTVRRALQLLQGWSKKSPHNFAAMVLLLEAELFSVTGKHDEAYEKYTCAIAMAAASGFTWLEAVALERVAWHMFRQPNADLPLAESYFEKACAKYEAWGAFGKVEDLRTEVQSIFVPMKLSLNRAGKQFD